MYKDLGIKDRLKVINTGVKTGKTPAQAVYLYNQSLNGGYNEWLKEMSKRLGVDVSKDPRYYYKLFYDNNPENAWDLLEGKTDGSVLEQYKNKEYEKLMLLQGQLRKNATTINDLMDYSLFEKLINNYMNQSINMHAYGGPVNVYAEGTNNLNDENDVLDNDVYNNFLSNGIAPYTPLQTSTYTIHRSLSPANKAPNQIEITPQQYEQLKKQNELNILGDQSDPLWLNVMALSSFPSEFRNMPRTVFAAIPLDWIMNQDYGYKPRDINSLTMYYLLDFEQNENGNYVFTKLTRNSEPYRVFEFWNQTGKELRDATQNGTAELQPVTVVYDKRTGQLVGLGFELPEGVDYDFDYTDRITTGNDAILNETDEERARRELLEYLDYYNLNDNKNEEGNSTLPPTDLEEGEGSGEHSNNGVGEALAPAAGYSEDAPVYYQEPFLIDWSMPLFEAYPITGINWPETEKQYLLPPGYVQIPNYGVQQVTDNGPDQGLNFRDFLFNLVGYTDSSFRDALMAQMMLPKDYFSDPYAGLNYTNTTLGNAGFNNDPYTQIQRESNGTPLYANGGPVNLFAGGGYNVNAYRRQHQRLLRKDRNRRPYRRPSGLRPYNGRLQQSQQLPEQQTLVTRYPRIQFDDRPAVPSDNTRVYIPQAEMIRRNTSVEEHNRRLNELTRNTRRATARYIAYTRTGGNPIEVISADLHPDEYIAQYEVPENQTFIGPDNRSDWERNEGLLIINNRWRIEDLKRLEAEADEAIMHMLKPLSPSTWIGAVGRAARSNDGFLRTASNFIGDLTYNDENVGVASAFGEAGERWAAAHPMLNLGLNLGTDIATAKALGAIGRLSNFRFRIPINENFYYRLGRGLALDAIDSGVIRSGVDPLTGTQQYIHPYFSKGRLHYGNSPRYDVIVNTGKGKYNWEGLNGADQIVPGGKMTVSGYNGRGTMTIDPGFRTPLVDGKPNLASTTDFDLYVPINKRIFGRDVNLGYWKRPLGQSNPEPSFLLPSQEEAAFSYDPITGYRYTGYQQPNFSLSSPIKPKDINVGPAGLFPLPSKPVPELTTNDIVDLPYFITQDNRTITPEKWDKLFYDAVSRNDTKMILSLRDYHFIELAQNNNFLFPTFDTLNPATLRHVVADLYNPNFNIFDPTIEGTNSFIYTTDSAPMASSYFSRPITVQDVAKFRDYYGDLWKKGLQLRLDGFRKTLADIQEAENNGFQTLTDYYKSINRQGYLTYSPSNGLPLPKLRTIFEQNFNSTLNDLINFLEYLNNQLTARGFNMPNPERMKNLYGALNNPVMLDANNGMWSDIGDYNIGRTLYGTGSTRDVERNIMFNHPDVDGFILNRVRDYGGRRQFGDWDPASVIGFRYPNLLKYKAGITYDDNGAIIPLSKRDNFEIGDLRFSKGGSLKNK